MTGDPACPRRESDADAAVLLRMHPDVVTERQRLRPRRRTVGETLPKELRLEDLAHLRRAPVLYEELQPGMVPGSAVPVFAKETRDARPHVYDVPGRNERAESDREHRVCCQPAAPPEVVAGAELRMLDADEGDVIQLVVRAVHPAAVDRRLVLARQVGELGGADEALVDRADLRRCVEHLVSRNARERAAEDHAGGIAARFSGREPGGLEALEDRGDVLDADPVELDVLTVRDIGDVAAVTLGCPGDRAELLGAHAATVDPDPHHEELVLELLRLRGAGPLARDVLPALRIQAPPSHPATQILLAARAEPAGSEDALDPLADVERLRLLLYLLGGVEGLVVAERPLPFASGARGSTGGRGVGHRPAREGAPATRPPRPRPWGGRPLRRRPAPRPRASRGR